MSRTCLLSSVLICLLVCHPLDAKGGKGGGKGGGGKGGGGPKISRGGGGPKKSISPGGGKSFSPQQKSVGGGKSVQSPSGKGKPDLTTKAQGQGKPDFGSKGKPDFAAKERGNGQTTEKLTGRDRAVHVQRDNEERKLTQRQQTAAKLREISERNGNENLKDVADRMDERAMEHYDKRQAKIDQLEQRGTDTPFDQNDFSDPLDQPLTDQQIANLEDPVLQQNHRFLNEQRKFEHQMQIADQLRQISARNGNPNLLDTASRMEQMAADRFASQFTKIFGPDTPIPDPLATSPLIEPLTAPLPLP